MAYSADSFSAGEQPTTAKWNKLWSNDASFNDGTGIGTNAIAAASLKTNAIQLGFAQITAGIGTASASYVQATGLTSTVTVPAGGRSVKVTVYTKNLTSSAPALVDMSLWSGVVGSGTQLQTATANPTSAAVTTPVCMVYFYTPSAGSVTFNVGFRTTAGSSTLDAASTGPAFILVELI